MNPTIAKIVKALAYAENGGKPTQPKAGKTGEMKSIFQYTPDTWKIYSKQISGEDNLPLDNESETAVTYGKVGSWYDQDIKEGYSPEEAIMRIASRWNAGEQRPDAYKQGVKGINKKYGVAYDTPAYAKKVADYAKQFEGGSPQEVPISNPTKSPGLIKSQLQNAVAPTVNKGIITPAMKETKQV